MIRWKDYQEKISDVHVIIYYNQFDKLYPMTEWLHPGAIPIGDGLIDDLNQDLPNLDWIIRHLAWLGFAEFTIVSTEDFRGLNLFYKYAFPELKINFDLGTLDQCLKGINSSFNGDILILNGHMPTNANLRHSILLHRQRENLASLLCIRGLQFRIGLASIQGDNEIVEFKEKPVDKNQLLNTDIIILSSATEVIDQQINAILDDVEDENHVFEQLRNAMIEKSMLEAIELTGISGEPWFQDLSQLENWVKLDYSDFIGKFSHLYIKEKIDT